MSNRNVKNGLLIAPLSRSHPLSTSSVPSTEIHKPSSVECRRDLCLPYGYHLTFHLDVLKLVNIVIVCIAELVSCPLIRFVLDWRCFGLHPFASNSKQASGAVVKLVCADVVSTAHGVGNVFKDLFDPSFGLLEALTQCLEGPVLVSEKLLAKINGL